MGESKLRWCKRLAKKDASSLRKKGYLVRVIKRGKAWVVWKRKK
jgi:hypothetical protein